MATGMAVGGAAAPPAAAAVTYDSCFKDLRTIYESKDRELQQQKIEMAQVRTNLAAAKAEATSHKKKVEELVTCILLIVPCRVMCALCALTAGISTDTPDAAAARGDDTEGTRAGILHCIACCPLCCVCSTCADHCDFCRHARRNCTTRCCSGGKARSLI
jgi:hypothetical protein